MKDQLRHKCQLNEKSLFFFKKKEHLPTRKMNEKWWKLGTSGLIVAYKAAALEAISNATIIEKTVDDDVYFAFEYPFMNDVMRIVKEEEPEILEQSYDMDCLMRLRIRRSLMPKLQARLEKVESLRFIEDEEEEELEEE